ncbi:hypothetical protein Cni_G00976 [Canna indica]|uniref:Uncharacterized protein n=1 Tax=Canna indica TaxID=4628 RepID=A0AAQ3JP84_9LILI|nr:hypothetical protein Cni_G00976 [Canna indica]
MKETGDSLPTTAAMASPKRHSPTAAAAGHSQGKRRYKLWALGAILLLALWSMLTGTVTLKRSAVRPSDDLGPALEDLDVLEMEERQKVVRRMWDVYAHRHGGAGRLPKFWQEAFEAAYEELAGDDPAARDAAVAEIARISMRMVDLRPPPQSPKNAELEKKDKDGDGGYKSNSTSMSSVKAQ